MAVNAFMKITGQKQGVIKGAVTSKGRENTIEINDLTYGVVTPRDAASGLPKGKRQHQPIQVTVPTGPQTPELFTAIASNENLTSVEIDFYLGAGGREKLAFTIKLTNASISEFDLNLESDTDLLDQYSFTFQKIVLTWAAGGITGEDDWEAPTA